MRILISLLFAIASAALGQQARTIALVNPQSPRGMQELATILRTVADAPKIAVDNEHSTITIDGTAEQMGRGEWLIHEMDKPADWRPSEQERANPSVREYKGEIRAYFMAGDPDARSVQEALTILRTVLDVQKIFNFTSLHALIWRGTQAELDAAEWVLKQIDVRPDARPADSGVYTLPDYGPHFNDLRVFYLQSGFAPKEMQRLITELRSSPLSVMKVFNYTAVPAVVVRGTAAQVDQAARVIDGYRKQPG